MSRRLMTVFGAVAIVCGYLFLGENNRYFMLPAGIAGLLFIVTWVMQHQIDWAWYERHPQKLDDSMQKLYEKSSGFYRSLKDEEKAKFGKRATLYVQAKEFIGMGQDKVAEDLKFMVAFYAILLTLNRENFLYHEYDRIVFYLHPFLSPNYNERVHTYEVEHTDGTIILSVDELVTGFMSPSKFYQTGLHSMAEVFFACYAVEDFPEFGDRIWSDLEQISGVSLERIEKHVGMKQDDPRLVVVHHYIAYAEKFAEISPVLFATLLRFFGHARDEA
jgi:glucose-regulated metallopeptidase M90